MRGFMDAGAEQRRVQERVAPRGGERGARAHVGGIFPVPVQQRGDQPGGGARPRRGRARVPSYTYDDEYYKFWSRNLDQEHCLELFRT